MRVYDAGGAMVNEDCYEITQRWAISQQVRHFADCLLDEEIKPVSTAKEHLLNVAIIESAYLSVRTKLPETLKVYGSVIDIE